MPSFGGYTPFPIRMGESVAQVEVLTNALNASRGDAYDVTESSNVWVENHAIARAIADVWQTNERLGLQTDLLRTSMVERWEAIFGIVPSPEQTQVERRSALQQRQKQVGLASTYQRLEDAITAAFGTTLPFSIELTPSTSGNIISNDPAGWYVSCSSATQPACTLSGVVTSDTLVEVTILSGGTTATIAVTVGTSSPTFSTVSVTTTPLVIANTSLTWTFGASSITAGTYYRAQPTPNGFSSSACELTILCFPPSWMSDAEYYDTVARLRVILDDVLPAWASFHVARDGTVPGSFILDEPRNLDNQRLS